MRPLAVGTVRVVNLDNGQEIAARAGLATSLWARSRGLLGRRALPEGEGLVIEQNWGGCQGNSVCGLTNGSCYIRMYATCQDRLTGTGDPCQGC